VQLGKTNFVELFLKFNQRMRTKRKVGIPGILFLWSKKEIESKEMDNEKESSSAFKQCFSMLQKTLQHAAQDVFEIKPLSEIRSKLAGDTKPVLFLFTIASMSQC